MTRAATWDDVDADLATLQRFHQFYAQDGQSRLLARVRASLAELRHAQGESEPLRASEVGITAGSGPAVGGSSPPPAAKPQLHLTSPDVSKPTPTNKPKNHADRLEWARRQGFVGEDCQYCGQMTCRREGGCLKCYTCGEMTGCG